MSSTDTAAPSRLRRGIGGPLLFAFILGDVLGAGVYALMGVLSERVGGMLWAPLLAALVLALLTAGSYAELVTKYPRAGGAAVFAERAFKNRLVSFLVGFCMLAAGVVSAAGLSIAFAGQYLQTFVDVPVVPVAIVFLAVLAALNARGIRESMGANFVMTAIEVSGLVIVVVVVGVLLAGGGGDVSRVTQVPEGTGVASAVLAGRGFVLPDDVKGRAPSVLRHRVVVAPELEVEGRSADDVLASVLERIDAPK